MIATPRTQAGIVILLAIAACKAPQSPPPTPVIETTPTVERALPSDYVAIDDERPFAWRQADYLRDALETEIAALTLEVEVENSPESTPGPRKLRATQDRAALATQMMAARPRADAGSEFAAGLLPIDRFVFDFASETLRRDAYSLARIEAWRAPNRRFLATRDLADRDAALAARVKAFEDLARAMPLRKLLVDLTAGPIDDAYRAQSLGKLKLAYPDAPLPSGGFDAAVAQVPRAPTPAAGKSGAGSAPSAPAPSATGLPRLDGAEVAIREIPDLRALLTGASAGAPQR